MAKKKIKVWSEAELIDTFQLTKTINQHPTLDDWLNTTALQLDTTETTIFNKILQEATLNINAWNEEDLKMNFIAFIIDLANLKSTERYRTYYEKTLEGEVEGIYLKVKCDFMVAKGILDMVKVPYFHFQEYKKEKDPYGDPIAQLIQAFLIAQAKNNNHKPLYGCYIVGRFWYFVILEGKTYAVSKAYDSTQKEDLRQIIAILRKFKEILETRLLD